MIQTKEVSPVEVVRAFLERVAALDGKLKAFITVCADAALEAARAAEAELVAGRPAGPLHGVPYGPKDLYNTRGVRTTGGSKILADFVPTDDATVVSRLRAAVRARGAERPLRRRDEPVGRSRPSHRRRVVVWLGGRGRGGARSRGARLGHGRLDPHPRRALRDQRCQADVRAREPGGCAPARVVDGPRRADGADGGGLRADARRDGRLRPRGSDDERPARARLPGGAHGRGEGAPRGASARPLHRRRGARSP